MHLGVAALLGLATFAAVGVCLAYLDEGDRAVGFWLGNGIALAVLLRTPRHQWPLFVLCAFLGNMAAGMIFRENGLLYNAIACFSNVVQYCLIAFILRARFGSYFDLLQAREVGWLCALSLPATALKGVVQSVGALLTGHHGLIPDYPVTWFFSCLLGLFVLSLPLLALSSAPPRQKPRFDALGFALVGLLLVLVFLLFGPLALPGLYLIMPPLMLMAWRYGLFGAGWGPCWSMSSARCWPSRPQGSPSGSWTQA